MNIPPEMRFFVKGKFRKVLDCLADVPREKAVFTYEELTRHLSAYILSRKRKFFDERNIKVAMVENDPLGEAFDVRAFHRTQVTSLLRAQLIPYQSLHSPKNPEPEPVVEKPQLKPPPGFARLFRSTGRDLVSAAAVEKEQQEDDDDDVDHCATATTSSQSVRKRARSGKNSFLPRQMRSLLAGTSRNIYPLAAVQGCLATTFLRSFHLWQQIM